MTEFKLRTADDGDEIFLRGLFNDVKSAEFGNAGIPGPQLALLLDMQYRARNESYAREHPDMLCRIISSGDQRVGSIFTRTDAEALHLIDISILANMRGQGIGTAVMEYLKTEANRITLNVFTGNSDARRLYERLGFGVLGGDSMYLEMEWKNA